MRRPIVFVSLAMLTGVVLAATVFRNDVAKATGLAGSAPVVVTNTTTNAVPVKEQNLDGSGNIKTHEQGTAKVSEQNVDGSGNVKVHEQGTADVHVTNSSLPVALDPVTDGSDFLGITGNSGLVQLSDTLTATALDIHMTSGVDGLALEYSGGGGVAQFPGPDQGASADIVLALNRPIKFDEVRCNALSSLDICSIGIVGALP